MKFSYSGDPRTSAKDQVRFLVGDTDEAEPLLSDGEIHYLLSLYQNSPLQAAIRACETIMAKFGRLVDESVGSVRLSYSQRITGYQTMRNELRQRISIEDCKPFAGGISKTQVEQTDLDPNRVEPDFTRHMMQNEQESPWVQGQSGGSADIAPG